MYFVVWKHVWVRKCVKIYVMLFENWKHVFKIMYQTIPLFQILKLLVTTGCVSVAILEGWCSGVWGWYWAFSLDWLLVGGLLVAFVPITSTWASICSTSSFRLSVSSSSIGPVGFCAAGREYGKGIQLGSLKWESSSIPEACRVAIQPSWKHNCRASLTTDSTPSSVSANPSLYHLFSQASKAA